jgi:MHS family proline/betaine transporter-like MFS transporter
VNHNSKDSYAATIMQVGIAHMLELYDFTLFAVLLPVIVPHFFPMYGYESGMIIGYVAFAISFFIAPLGSIIWGYLGDKFGSSIIMRASLFIMALPSVCISMLPTYDQIGLWAPLLLILLRIFQGISASGAVLGSKIFVFDKVDKAMYISSSCIISGFGSCGVLVAIISGGYASHFASAWRISFLMGGVGMFCILLLRSFAMSGKEVKVHKAVVSIWSFISVLKENAAISRKALMISGVMGAFSYFMHSFMVNFQISMLARSTQSAYFSARFTLFGVVTISLILALIAYRRKLSADNMLKTLSFMSIFLFPILYFTIVAYPIEYVINISMFFMGVLLGAFAGLSSVVVIASFAQGQRCRGALLANSFGVAIFGGLTPIGMSYLASISQMLPGAVLGCGFLILYLMLRDDTQHSRLT